MCIRDRPEEVVFLSLLKELFDQPGGPTGAKKTKERNRHLRPILEKNRTRMKALSEERGQKTETDRV